jgi:DNA-binding MarR family transcriptional regulator
MESCEFAEELGTTIGRLSVLVRQAALPPRMNLAQARTLLTLHHCGPRRVTELARLEHLRQPTMSAVIARMEGLGWVQRCVDEVDRRAVVVCLTDAGERFLQNLIDARTAALQPCLDTLSASDRKALAAALPALHKLIEQAQRNIQVEPSLR